MPQPDVIAIEDLELDVVIGAYDWERDITQRLILTLEMPTTTAAASTSDNLGDVAVDYAPLVPAIRDLVTESRYHLLETLAESVAKLAIETLDVEWVRLQVRKPRPDAGFTASLRIERNRNEV